MEKLLLWPKTFWKSRLVFSKLLVLSTFLAAYDASAYDILPYTVRTHDYSGWSTTVQGDLRSVGMGGATVGLGDSFLDATDNPAGLAMTTNDASANFAGNIFYDGHIQNYNNALSASNIATSSSIYPWGFGLNYRSRVLEGQEYAFAATPNTPVNYSIRTGDLYLSVAHLFLHDRLSVGATLILGQAEERAESPGSTFSNPGQTWGIGMGASWQFPSHLILGLNFAPSVRYQFSAPTGAAPPLTGFLQTIEVPYVLGLGLGWIPNRFFRTGFSMHLLGPTTETALLRDDSIRVGLTATLQPKLGASYLAVDYKELSLVVNLGTYLEISRIQNVADRLHLTSSLEVNPWIFNFGVGLDTTANYRNYIFSFGVDVIKTMEKLDLIPHSWRPPHGGMLPNIFHISDEGLPRALSKNWRSHGEMNPIEVGLAIPGKIEEKAVSISKIFSHSKPKTPKKPRRPKKLHRRAKAAPHPTQPN